MGGLERWRSRSSEDIPQSPYPMPTIIWEILHSRGFKTSESIQDFLSPKLKDLKNPFELMDLRKSVERLIEAHNKQETIAIYGDFDLDGTSGLAMLHEGLKGLGFQNLLYYQPKRLTEGYGIHAAAIEKLATQGATLVLSVDVGITAFEAANKAKELAVDLIITDHHLPAETLPGAFAVINPNRKDCTSGLGYLCGTGVAFFLLLGLKNEMARQNIFTSDLNRNFNLKELLDFFVIATLTDMVPLVKENRVLVKHGLIKISQTHRPGLKFLMQEIGMWDRLLTSQEIAIGLAPKLNALSRIESTLLPRDVLLVSDEIEAKKMVAEILKTQELRKQYQSFALEKAFELLEMLEQSGYIWIWSHEFHKGVIGLVATQLVQRFGVPCFVGSVNENGKISGSARCPDDSPFDLTQILKMVGGNLEKHGGHAKAAGFQLDILKTSELDCAFQDYFNKNVADKSTSVIVYDAVGTLEQLNPSFMKWYTTLEPFGTDFPAVLIRFANVAIFRRRELKGGHLKFTFKQHSSQAQGVLFSPADALKGFQEGDVVDVVALPQWNYFNGSKEIQLLIKDIQ